MKLHLLVTAGPTQEPIDPVRYLSNYSTGTMGYAVAQEARRRRHQVTLVSGPTALRVPQGVRVHRVVTARQMYRAVMQEWPRCDALIMAAAVSDFQPRRTLLAKLKKTKRWRLALVNTPDILASVATRRRPHQLLVGFALESERLLERARRKLASKHLDLIVANPVGPEITPFGDRPTTVWLIDRTGHTRRLVQVSKQRVARAILDFVEHRAMVESTKRKV